MDVELSLPDPAKGNPDKETIDHILGSIAPHDANSVKHVPFPSDFVIEASRCLVPAYQTTKVVNVKERWRGRSIAEVFAEEFKLAKPYIEKATAEGRLLINNSECEPQDLLSNGDVIKHVYTIEEPAIRNECVLVIAENEHVLVAQKPCGMPCHPQGKYHRASLTELLLQMHLGEPQAYLHPVNRLDRPTSGIVLLAKTRKAYMLLSRELLNMRKLYLARVQGLFNLEAAARATSAYGSPCRASQTGDRTLVVADTSEWNLSCNIPLTVEKHRPNQPLTVVADMEHGKPSQTLFRVLHSFDDGSSLMLCQPVTGRTHQIRVHLMAMGFPIVGDPLYGANGAGTEYCDVSLSEESMCLHAFAYGLEGTSEEAKEILRMLPVPPGESSTPAVVYRCHSNPLWARNPQCDTQASSASAAAESGGL